MSNWNGSVRWGTPFAPLGRSADGPVGRVSARPFPSRITHAKFTVPLKSRFVLPWGMTAYRARHRFDGPARLGYRPRTVCRVRDALAALSTSKPIRSHARAARRKEVAGRRSPRHPTVADLARWHVGSQRSLRRQLQRRIAGSVKSAMKICDWSSPPRLLVHIRRLPSGLNTGRPSKAGSNVIRVLYFPAAVIMNRS